MANQAVFRRVDEGIIQPKECAHRPEHIIRELVLEPRGEGVQGALGDVLAVLHDAEGAADQGLCLLGRRRLACAAVCPETRTGAPEVEPPLAADGDPSQGLAEPLMLQHKMFQDTDPDDIKLG